MRIAFTGHGGDNETDFKLVHALLDSLDKTNVFLLPDQRNGIARVLREYIETNSIQNFKTFYPNFQNLDHPDAVIKTSKDGTGNYNAAARLISHQEMIEEADMLFAFSTVKGQDCVRLARKKGIPVVKIKFKRNDTPVV